MKKTELSHSAKTRNLIHSNEYYQDIGKSAALFAFTKKSNEPKNLLPISPRIKRILSPDITASSLKGLKILKEVSPRDISYLKDKAKSPSQKLKDLPSDLEDLKKAFHLNQSYNLPSPNPQHETCNESLKSFSQTSQIFAIEKFAVSSPSGRQVSENLKKWLENMKHTYCLEDLFGENALLIHKFCSSELIKQISVSCIEQGKVLQELMDFYSSFASNLQLKINSLEKSSEEKRKNYLIKIDEKEKEHRERVLELQINFEGSTEKLQKKKEKIAKLKNKITRLESMAEEYKKGLENADSKIRVNYVRKRTGFGKPGLFESKSPLIGKKWEFENSLELFEGTMRVCSYTQTEKLHLSTETFTDLILFDSQDKEEEIVIDVNEVDNTQIKPEGKNESFNESEESQASDDSISKAEKKNKSKILKEKSRHPVIRRELLAKQTELNKKINEKQNELKAVSKKIKAKIAELDFLTQTIHYKKIKESFEENNFLKVNPDLSLDSISQLKPANSKTFNILSDLAFWGESNEKSPRSFQLNKSLTIAFNSNTSTSSPEKYSKMNTIREHFQNEEDEESDIHLIDSARKSINLDNESFQEPSIDKSFRKKSTVPLEDLPSKIDLFLVENKKKEKKSQPFRIIEKICQKKIEWIKSKSGMNRRLLNKLIYSLYLSFYSRHNFSEDFVDHVYYDFFQRYGLRFVSDKKFIEFICSLVTRDDSRKYVTFLRFIGAGSAVNKVNYSQYAFQLFLEGLSYLINSKIGVVFNEDYTNKFHVPVIRASELAKEQLDLVDKTILQRALSLLESKSIPDPKRFNISGLVDGEAALEIIIDCYESLKFKYITGVETILNLIKYGEPKDVIMKNEIRILIQQIFPKETEEFEVHFEDVDSFSVEQLCYYSVNKKIFAINDITEAVKDEGFDTEYVESLVGESINRMQRIVEEMENVEKYMKTLDKQLWKCKLNNLVKGIKERKPHESLFVFRVFLLELLRVQSTYL